MKESFGLIIIAFLSLVLALSIWNLLIMYKIKNSIKGKSTLQSNELFLELKSRIQLISTIFSIVVVILTYFGFTTEDRIQQRIYDLVSKEFGKYETRFQSIDSSLINNESFIKSFNIEKQAITSTLLSTGQSAKEIQKNINLLASKKLSGINLYIVSNLKIDTKPDRVRIYYKDLSAADGRKLPKFTRPPSLKIEANYPVGAIIHNNNNEYFEIEITMTTEGWDDTINLWIASND